MADFRDDNLVCDLTLIMRSRLLVGMFNRRSVSPRWLWTAKLYCVTLLITTTYVVYSVNDMSKILSGTMDSLWLLHWTAQFGQYFLAVIISLITGDEYIYNFFTRNDMTDVTLDSRMLFNRFQKQMRKAYIIAWLLVVNYVVLGIPSVIDTGGTINYLRFILSSFLEVAVPYTYTTKLLVMGLFNCRMLVLRRRLERYGFRTIGRAPPQPYCQIYDEIWEGMHGVDYSLKLMLFFDLISNTGKLISFVTYNIYWFSWQEHNALAISNTFLIMALTLCIRTFFFFGHVVLLESAAAHCEAMEIFTVTQLIKNPSAEERARMYALLGALERRGARYHVLRALPIDARLALSVLGFCTAQSLVLINSWKS